MLFNVNTALKYICKVKVAWLLKNDDLISLHYPGCEFERLRAMCGVADGYSTHDGSGDTVSFTAAESAAGTFCRLQLNSMGCKSMVNRFAVGVRYELVWLKMTFQK
jgi:hypothetical protein